MLSTTLVVKDGVNIFGEGPRFPSCRLGDEVLEQGAESLKEAKVRSFNARLNIRASFSSD